MEQMIEKFYEYTKSQISNYSIDDENRETIKSLILYFTNNKEFDKLTSIKNPSLKKGICLTGNIGTGKSLLMELLWKCKFPGKRFGFKTCRSISQKFMDEGYNGISIYGSKAVRTEYQKQTISHMLFDDFGAEQSMSSYYGNKVNVMAEILIDRYELFQRFELITHLTTNLDLDEIDEIYGNRVLSRMNQMFNFIVLGGKKDSKDRRIEN